MASFVIGGRLRRLAAPDALEDVQGRRWEMTGKGKITDASSKSGRGLGDGDGDRNGQVRRRCLGIRWVGQIPFAAALLDGVARHWFLVGCGLLFLVLTTGVRCFGRGFCGLVAWRCATPAGRKGQQHGAGQDQEFREGAHHHILRSKVRRSSIPATEVSPCHLWYSERHGGDRSGHRDGHLR